MTSSRESILLEEKYRQKQTEKERIREIREKEAKDILLLAQCHTDYNQGSQYCTDWYVPYWYIYQYRNINILYRFKYRSYWPISSTKKKFLFYFILFYFLSFVIFEFLLGKNGNLLALTYQYYLFSQYAIITFKLSIFYVVCVCVCFN